MLDDYLARWGLVPDGDLITTHGSRLLPVRCAGVPAMLKIAMAPAERRGARRGATVLVWWSGDGATRVLAHDGPALLMERALGDASLAAMARSGRDDDASRIICLTAARLHAPRDRPPRTVVPLTRWFSALEVAAACHGGVLRDAAATARDLLGTPRDVVVLHGDLHHGNILDAGPRGWLAIDPKGLVGERGFDFANIFCNPDREIATAPARLARQATVIAAAARLERERLLRWVLAYAGLSVTWALEDAEDPTLGLAVAECARAELANT